MASLLARDDSYALLAEEDGEAVGFAWVTVRPNPSYAGPVALLDELYVRPGRRGRRIGHGLLEEACRIARDRGAEHFEIGVDEGDTDARRFYEAHDFSETEPGDPERQLYYFRAP
jgi:GNAT superfamily N-acetyltransferase